MEGIILVFNEVLKPLEIKENNLSKLNDQVKNDLA